MKAPAPKDTLPAPGPVPETPASAPRRPRAAVRIFTLAWTSVAYGWIAAIAVHFWIVVLNWQARDGSLLESFFKSLDPGTLARLFLYAAPTILVGFLAGLKLLWHTDLTRTIPAVALATVLTAVLSGPLGFAMFPTLVVGPVVMVHCKFAYSIPGRDCPE